MTGYEKLLAASAFTFALVGCTGQAISPPATGISSVTLTSPTTAVRTATSIAPTSTPALTDSNSNSSGAVLRSWLQ